MFQINLKLSHESVCKTRNAKKKITQTHVWKRAMYLHDRGALALGKGGLGRGGGGHRVYARRHLRGNHQMTRRHVRVNQQRDRPLLSFD